MQAQNISICQTCIHAPECVHYRNCQIACRPIWFCENFDDQAPLHAPENRGVYAEAQSFKSSIPGPQAIPGRMQGLCLNCEDRAACRFPVVEGGIWYCEEYR